MSSTVAVPEQPTVQPRVQEPLVAAPLIDTPVLEVHEARPGRPARDLAVTALTWSSLLVMLWWSWQEIGAL